MGKQKLSEDEKIRILNQIIKYIDKSPEYAIFTLFKTTDPQDKIKPIKAFPDYPYLRELIKTFQEERLILVAKSRQMLTTWAVVAWCTWLAMCKYERQIFFVSKKETDADKLVKRALFIFEHLPKEIQTYYGPTSDKYCEIRFERTGSVIQGVSQESEALRMYTASAIFSDEMAFQEKAEKSWLAMRPTIDTGGQFIGVSTPNGKNFFYRMVYDID